MSSNHQDIFLHVLRRETLGMCQLLDPLTLSYLTDYQEPLFRTLAKFPEFADGPVVRGLEVNINYFAMEQLGLHYNTVWKAILEQCDAAADIDTREQQLFACMFPGSRPSDRTH